MTESEPDQYEFCDPVIHGVSVQAHHQNTGVYDALRQVWRNEIGDRDSDDSVIATYLPAHAAEPRQILLSSSRWKAGRDPDTQFYKYRLKIRDEGNVPPQALSVVVLPQKEGLVYPDGEPLELPYGEGARLKITTTFPSDKQDVFLRANELLNTILDDYNTDGLDPETGKITKLETHVRFDRERMPAVVDSLYNSNRLIGWDSMAEIDGEHRKESEGWNIWRFTATQWHRLGFDDPDGRYKWGLKAYSADNWQNEDGWMYHPKLEAYYAGTSTSNESLIDVSRWNEIVQFLRHIVVEHCRAGGVGRSDLVTDPHFTASDTSKYSRLEGRKDDLRNMYEATDTEIIKAIERSRSNVPQQIIQQLIDNPRGVYYSQISEDLSVSKKTIQRHSRRLEKSGLIDRIQIGQGGTQLRFKAPVIHDVASETLDEMTAGQTAAEARENDESGANRRRYASLAELGRTPSEIVSAVSDGDLDPDDVRVPRDWTQD